MIRIQFLGTSTMIPTVKRNNTAIYMQYKSEHFLIDCAEGTQRQMQIAGISPPKISILLITHWHGDHILGIPGLLQTLGASNYQKKLKIVGPVGTKKYLGQLTNLFISKHAEIDIEVIEVKRASKVIDTDEYTVSAQPVNHTAPCLAYSFLEKDRRRVNISYTKKFGLERHPLLGKLQKGRDVTYNNKKILASKATTIVPGRKVVFILDTAYTEVLPKFAKNADVLICESTMADELEDKAKEYKHLTPSIAANIAKKAKVKELILTHFSQRYTSTTVFKNQARRIFKKVTCATDFYTVEV